MGWSKDHGTAAKVNADYAKVQGDIAKQEANKVERFIEDNKTNWLPAVATVALRNSTYPNPQHGDTVRVTSEAKTYRFVIPTGWVVTDIYDATAIDQVTTQLAQVAKDTTNFQSLVNSRKLSMQKCRYRKLASRHFEIVFPLEDGTLASYQVKKNANDDYMRPTRTSILSEGITDVKTLQNYTVLSGNMNATAAPNAYTTEVGTKLKIDFIGHKAEIRFFTDNRGGVWQAKIDGQIVDTFSTHITQVSADYNSGRQAYSANLDGYPTVTRVIKEGLTDAAHTLELEFMGADPNNSPNGGTARGWIKTHSTIESQKTFAAYSVQVGWSMKEEIFPDYSNIDFAFSVMNPNTGDNPEFIPEHSNKGSLWAVSQKVYVDGVDITDSPIAENFSELEYSKVEVIQKCIGRYPGNTTDLVEINSLFTFVDGKMSLDIKFKALANFKINAGYFFMQPLRTSAFNRLKTGISNVYEIYPSPTYKNETISEKTETSDFIAYHTDKDYVLTLHVENKDEWLRTGANGNAQPTRKAWIEYRDVNLNKVYFSSFYGLDILKDFEYRASATYEVSYARGLSSIL